MDKKINKLRKYGKFAGWAVALLLMLMMLSKSCSGSFMSDIIDSLKPDTDVVIRIDTVRVVNTVTVVRVDTFYQERIVYLDRIVPTAPDTIYVEKGDTLSVYAGVSEDSTVTINYEATVAGQLKDLELGYKLKAPRVIERTVTKTVTDTKTITKELYKGGLYAGSGIRIDDLFKPIPTLDLGYLNKKGWYYGVRYEPTTKAYGITAMKRVF